MNRTFVTTTLFVGLLGPAVLASCTKPEGTGGVPAGTDVSSSTVTSTADEGMAIAEKMRGSFSRVVRSRELVPSRNDSARLASRGDHFVATARKGRDAITAAVDLPKDARGTFRVAAEMPAKSFALSVEALGARSSTGIDRDGILHYPQAYGPGTELAQVATTSGTEDYVVLESDSLRELSYRVNLSDDVAGLRLVSNTLEFLDESGAPRLRVASPYGVDAVGKRFDAKLALEGCAADTSPQAPWGRGVTSPGAKTCTVHVTWQSEGLSFPIAVDPAWTATQDMTVADVAYELPLVVLSGGKVLAVPGNTIAQIFDPATNTWAVTGASPFSIEHRGRMVSAGGNKAWATGGYYSNAMQKTASYDLVTGVWTSTLDTPNAGSQTNGKALAYVGNGKVLVFDHTGTVHEYDVAGNAYTAKTAFGSSLGYNIGAWLYNGEVYIQGGGINVIRKYNVANDVWTAYTANVFGPQSNTAHIEYLSNGKFLAWGGNFAYLFDPGTDSATPVTIPGTVPSLNYQCFRSASITYAGGKKHLIAAGRMTYDEDADTITDNGAASIALHAVQAQLQDGRILAAGQANGGSNKVDFWGPSSQAECDGEFGTPTKPVYSATSNTCVACANDNAGADPACPTALNPICLTAGNNKGACVECAAGKLIACSTATKPACNVALNKCAGANGDFGTNASIPCPSAANPYQKADGSCGKCTSNADCVGANHNGSICNVTSGACGDSCLVDGDCVAGKFCDTAGTKTCISKKADGAACGRKEECTSALCTAGKCGAGTIADAGTDSGPKTDSGTTSSSSGGTDSGTQPVTDSGTTSSSSSSGGAAGDTGGCGCKTSSDLKSNVGNFSVAGLVVVALGMMRRRRRSA